jgi:hypothetical protein
MRKAVASSAGGDRLSIKHNLYPLLIAPRPEPVAGGNRLKLLLVATSNRPLTRKHCKPCWRLRRFIQRGWLS